MVGESSRGVMMHCRNRLGVQPTRCPQREASTGGASHLILITACVGCLWAWYAMSSPSRTKNGEVFSRQLATSGNSTSSVEHVSGAVNPAVFFLVVFFTSALAQSIATILPEEIRLPHSVLLYFVGTFMAFLAAEPFADTEYGDAIESFANVDPHVIFWVFLPALLFEDAASASWPVIQRVLPSALLLALPGVILNTFVTGLFIRYVMNGWDFWKGQLLGSILSATDPVAVVGALTALSAPAKLSHLISGESLFNDGSAVALFQIFVSIAAGKSEFRLGTAVVDVVRLAGGGPLFGFVVALFACYWLKKARTLNIQVLIIICCVYGCFFVGEHKFKVSGVLAVVLFGLYMSAVGRFSLNPGVESEYHAIIKFLSLVSHESIFIIAGVIGYRFMIDTDVITRRDWLDLLLLYVAIHITRTLVIVAFWPFLRRMGYGLTVKEAIISVYGGLRGAVGLAMASLAAGEWQLGDTADAKRIGFHTAGIVVMTLLINGTTITALYKWLKVDPNKGGRHHQKLLRAGLDQADNSVMTLLEEYKSHWFFYNCDFETIEKLIPRLKNCVGQEKLDYFGKQRTYHQRKGDIDAAIEGLVMKFAKKIEEDPTALRAHCQGKLEKMEDEDFTAKESKRQKLVGRQFAPLRKDSLDTSEEMLSEVYQTVVNAMEAEYTEAYEEGKLPVAAYRVLLMSITYQEEAIWGELGLPKYGVPYPSFLDGESTGIEKLVGEPRMTQMKECFNVGWIYLQRMLNQPRRWHLRQVKKLLGDYTIALDWVLLFRNLNMLLHYISAQEHILEDTSLFTGFSEMLHAPLKRIKREALTTGLEDTMSQDFGMFLILEHLCCAYRIVVEMRHTLEHQRREGTLSSEDAERIKLEVLDPSAAVLQDFVPQVKHLAPVQSSLAHKVRPWLDRWLVDTVLERTT